MTYNEINQVMDTHGSQEYFDAHVKWISENAGNLSALYRQYRDETDDAITFEEFNCQMFNETKPGREAAEKYLRPLLNQNN